MTTISKSLSQTFGKHWVCSAIVGVGQMKSINVPHTCTLMYLCRRNDCEDWPHVLLRTILLGSCNPHIQLIPTIGSTQNHLSWIMQFLPSILLRTAFLGSCNPYHWFYSEPHFLDHAILSTCASQNHTSLLGSYNPHHWFYSESPFLDRSPTCSFQNHTSS